MITIYTNWSKRNRGKLLSLFSLLAILSCGTVDETDTGITAKLYNPDLTPAAGAKVKIFKTNDTKSASEVICDQNGNYSVKGLTKGRYNVYAEKGELVAFQDSISVLEDTILIEDDTLETPVNLSGVIGLQPNHDPRTVTVQVLGTDIYSNVNEDGYFKLNRMAKGEYVLKLSTTLDNYTTTYINININANTADTLPDTLWLIYTGIPVVEGLSAAYDTLNGVVKLSWNSTKYRDFQEYLVYRDYFDTIKMSSAPVFLTKDTVLYDSIFKKNLSGTAFSLSDTNDYHFKYRVTVRNNSQIEGLSYKYYDIIAASPKKVQPDIKWTVFHQVLLRYTDTCSINDTIKVFLKITDTHRKLHQIKLTFKNSTDVRYFDSSMTGTNEFTDALFLTFDSIGLKKISIEVLDIAGDIWNDTISIMVVKDTPVIASIDSVYTKLNRQLSAKITDNFGQIKQYFWKIADKEWQQTSEVISPKIEGNNLFTETECSLKVVDDDGNIALEGKKIRYIPAWQKRIHNLPFSNQSIIPFVHNSKMMIGNGNNFFQIDSNFLVSLISSNLPIIVDDACSFKNLFWIMEHATYDSSASLYNSIDGIVWNQIVRKNHITNSPIGILDGFLIRTDSLLFVSDIDSLGAVSRSSDGINWNNSGDFHDLYPTMRGFYNELIYEITICQNGWTGTRLLDWTCKTIIAGTPWITGPKNSGCSSGDNFITYENHIILPDYVNRELFHSVDGLTWKKMFDIPKEIDVLMPKKLVLQANKIYLITSEELWSFD